MLFRSSLLGAIALLAWHVQAQAGAPAPIGIELRANAVVDHGRVTLADVATLKADHATATALSATELAAAPRLGYTERLTRAQIEQRVRRRADYADVTLAWSGADAVSLRTAAQTVNSSVLIREAMLAAQAALVKSGRQFNIGPAAVVADVEVPVGQLTIRPRAIDHGVLETRLPVWLDLLVDGAAYRSVLVPLNASAINSAYVAKRDLAAGAWASADDFAVAETNVFGIEIVHVGPTLAPFRLTRSLRSGQVLSKAAQVRTGHVLRGDQVRVQFKGGQIGIEATAAALADGVPGQLLQVRVAGAKDIIAGRLDQSGTVTIE